MSAETLIKAIDEARKVLDDADVPDEGRLVRFSFLGEIITISGRHVIFENCEYCGNNPGAVLDKRGHCAKCGAPVSATYTLIVADGQSIFDAIDDIQNSPIEF